MVLSYLRWEADAAANFGLVASPGCNGVVFLKSAGLALTGCGESVSVWHLKQGALLARMQPEGHEYEGVGAKLRAQVTCLIAHPRQADIVAAGYSDGSIRLWSIAARKEQVTLHGHRGVVTTLCFSKDGSRLYSGGADTDIIAWDVVGETGLFRMRGHKAPITSLLLLESNEGAQQHNHIVSGSKDQLVKIWDLSTQACVQTLVGHRAEVTALATTHAEKLLVSGAAEGPLRVWHIHDTGRNDAPAPRAATKEKKITVKLEPGVAAPAAAASSSSAAAASSASTSSSSLFSAAEGSVEMLTFWGFLPRDSHKRVTGLEFWPARSAEPTLLLALSADKQLDLFHVRPSAEIEKKVKRRIKRQREKQKKHAANGTEKPAGVASSAAAKTEAGAADSDMADASDPASATDASNGAATTAIPIDQFQSLLPLRTSVKIVSCAASSSASHLRVLLSMHDNSVQVWSIDLAGARSSMDEREEKGEVVAASGSSSSAAASAHYTPLYNLTAGGHRTGVRVVALSSDGSVCMTASSEQVKIWNVVSKACIRTIDSGYALCGFFVPGSRHVLIGTKAGEIELYDLSTGSCLQKIAAHGVPGSATPTPVYALDLRPDQKGFVSGGGDKELKVWDFELVMMQWDAETAPQRSLQIVHTKTLKLTDDILAVRCSPDGKMVAVGLLDSTIKVFYADSLKFFLSLYGHKLPVLSIDISSDSNLLVSGSADKNLKLWGLDFGDCHKSMFGHGDSITAVRFLRGTHQFWSAGKDKLLKLWDGDTFEMIQVLEAHTAEVWSLALNHQGTLALSVGNDKSVRVIRQSDQQLFLEEERETRLEKIYDAGATTEAKPLGDMAGSGLAADGASASALVARKGANEDSLKSGERIMEALDLADADRERWLRYDEALREQKELASGRDRDGVKLTGLAALAADQKRGEVLSVPQTNPLIRGPNADAHMLLTIQAIKTPELDEALLILPFDYACRLLPYLNRQIAAGVAVELCVHALLFLLSAHHKQLVSNQVMLSTLRESRDHVRAQLQGLKAHIGFNLAALRFVQRQAKEQAAQFHFGDKDDAAAMNNLSAAPVTLDPNAASKVQEPRAKRAKKF